MAKYMPEQDVPSNKGLPHSAGSSPTGGENNHGLQGKMPMPAGSLKLKSGGKVVVADGGWNNGMGGGAGTNAQATTPTNMAVGKARMLGDKKPKNIYCSGDSVK